MSFKRISPLIVFVLTAATLLFVPSCKRDRQSSLQFICPDKSEKTQQQTFGLVVVTHGWIEKGRGYWPEDMAGQLYKHTDPNLWLCGYFDWSDGAKTINPTDAAKYARDTAGAELAAEITKLSRDWKHIHLIGHSCGCWVISEAAKILSKQTKADIHLTFLDAYIPPSWQESSLGDVNTAADVNYWADQYYTRDYTLSFTEQDLTHAHNVDVTKIDQLIKDHNFPWHWYYATISGKFPKGKFLDNGKLVWTADGIEYGFARSAEADPNNWAKSLRLAVGNKAVELVK